MNVRTRVALALLAAGPVLALPAVGFAQVCGDGAIAATEGCDDGNTTAGDGCSGACVVESGFACVPSLHASGVSPAGAILPTGSTDPHWTWSLSAARTSETHGYVARNAAWASLPPGNWVTTDATFGAALTTQPDTYWFQDVFMPPSFVGTLSFNVAVSADNEAEVFINGVSYGTVVGFTSATTRVVPASAFVAGVNTVMIRLREYNPGTPRGILMYPGGGGILSQCTVVCSGSADCDDGNECTDDSCVAGACLNASRAPGTACSVGVCSDPTPVSTCGCSSVDECDDGNDCTTDACAASGCTNVALTDGATCPVGTCSAGVCTTECGDGVLASLLEGCDDGNDVAMDGCSATCDVESGWSCSCSTPTFDFTEEGLAGRIGGDGGTAGPDLGCSGSDVLIGLAIAWGTGTSRPEAIATTTVCGEVSVAADGTVTTTPTTRETYGGDGGPGCDEWATFEVSPDVLCPSGSAIVGIHGAQSEFDGTPTFFRALSIDCQALRADGTPFGPITNFPIPGGGTGGVAQDVSCPTRSIASFFRARGDCAIEALELHCGVPAVECGGAGSVCGTSCGDGAVGAPLEACDDAGESPTCDLDCTPVRCGDGTTNASAGEACDGSGETSTCNLDCTASTCGDGTQNVTAGESCDDGNTVDGDGCSSTCVSETCGDGLVQGTESCDDGGASETCDADCTAVMCGDGTRNALAEEDCDDGNTAAGDGCSPTCEVERNDAGMPGTDAGVSDAGVSDAGGAMDAGTPGVAGGACGCRAGQRGGYGGLSLVGLVLSLLAARRRRKQGA